MSDASPQPAPTYLQLRDRILHLQPAEVGLTSSGNQVWAVVMETGYEVGTATLLALADGTASLNFSTGGGLLGSGEYPPVAEASKALIAQAERLMEHVSPAQDYPLPEPGQVRFYWFTYSGSFTAQAAEAVLAPGMHPLSSLYSLGRETMAQLRLLADRKRK